MRLGIKMNPSHSSADEWADKLTTLGLRTAMLPCDERADDAVIDAYLRAAKEQDISIGEVGAWCNPLSADPSERKANMDFCKRRLAFADHIGARCCVNITGTLGEKWDGPYASNYGADAFKRAVDSIREIIDAVNPSRTFYTVEPMPWMIPDSPEQYLELIKAVDHPRFAVHLDVVNMISSPFLYFHQTDLLDRCFSLLAGRIRACHVKDIKLGETLTTHLSEVPCGEGTFDIARYARLATAEDPDMPFLIEHQNNWDAYMRCLENVKGTLSSRCPERRS